MYIQVYHILVILHIFETLSLLLYLSWWSLINNPTIFDVTIILWLAEGSDDGYHFVPTKLFLIKKKILLSIGSSIALEWSPNFLV